MGESAGAAGRRSHVMQKAWCNGRWSTKARTGPITEGTNPQNQGAGNCMFQAEGGGSRTRYVGKNKRKPRNQKAYK